MIGQHQITNAGHHQLKNSNIQHSFRFLVHGFQPYSSNIPSCHHSKSNPHSPAGQQLHASSVHVEMAGSFIVLHTRVLSALRHLYSCDFRDTSFLIRFWTHSRLERAFILLSEENKKSEPFSYREKVRIFYFSGSPPGRHSYGLGTAH